MPDRPITTGQIKHIHSLLRVRDIPDADYRARLRQLFDKDSCKELTVAEGIRLSEDLRHFRTPPPTHVRERGDMLVTERQRALINALVSEIDWRRDDGYERWLAKYQGIEHVRTSKEAARAIRGLLAVKHSQQEARA